MHWILVVWLTKIPAAGIQMQELISKEACIQTGAALKKQIGYDVTFTCVPNGVEPKEKENGPKKTRSHH